MGGLEETNERDLKFHPKPTILDDYRSVHPRTNQRLPCQWMVGPFEEKQWAPAKRAGHAIQNFSGHRVGGWEQKIWNSYIAHIAGPNSNIYVKKTN